jgi:BirA family biotin operon repressor/biotin-[acetyl-CoA-carboxylase] ligase
VNRLQADLDELEGFGFAIERHPYWGAAYRGPADRLCPDQIEADLRTRSIGRRIAVWNRVASTNDIAVRAAASTANEGFVVLAEEQSAGRGRRGRTWVAPPRSSILMSVLLFPPRALAETAWLTALGAVAAAEVVAAWTGPGAEITIKWPNDVRAGGRKIAGVLVERGQGAVIGIGLNANLDPDGLPTDLRAAVTSLSLVTGRVIDRSELARMLIQRLDTWYELGRAAGPESLNHAWRNRCEHLGQTVTVTTPHGLAHGRLDDVHIRNGLRLATADGRQRLIPIPEVLAVTPVEPESMT